MSGRHAGQIISRPGPAYTGRHEAVAVPKCRAYVHVASLNGEGGGLLVCDRDEHDDDQHYDDADSILWRTPADPITELAEPAGAVA